MAEKKQCPPCLDKFKANIVAADYRDVGQPYINLSSNSKLAIYNYGPYDYAPDVPGFEIFNISNGQLMSILTFPSQDGDFASATGTATSDFRKVLVLDEDLNGSPTSTTVRLRLYNFEADTLNLVATQTIDQVQPIYSGNQNGFYAASWTDDSKYIVLKYMNMSGATIIQVLKGEDLTFVNDPVVVAEPPPPTPESEPIVIANGPYMFRLCKHGKQVNYFSVVWAVAGALDTDGKTVLGIQPPFTWYIYRVNENGSLTRVKETVLPQFANTLAAFNPTTCCLEKTNILSLSRPTYLSEDQPSVFRDLSNVQSGTGETGNVRVYSFNGEELKLLAYKNFDTTILGGSGVWYPDGQTFAISPSVGSQFNLPISVEEMSFYRIEICDDDCHKKYVIRALGGLHSIPPISDIAFTPDGKHLAVVGFGLQSLGDDPVPAINNVLLYEIKSCYQPLECDSASSETVKCCGKKHKKKKKVPIKKKILVKKKVADKKKVTDKKK
jgi:hypothetical protein